MSCGRIPRWRPSRPRRRICRQRTSATEVAQRVRLQIQGQAVPRHLPEAGCAVEGKCGGLGAHHFEVEGPQGLLARFLDYVAEDGARYARPPGFWFDIELLDPEGLASLLYRDDLVREQDADGLAVALGEPQPGPGARSQRRVESAIDPIRVGGEVMLDQLRREQGVDDGAVTGFGATDAETHCADATSDVGVAPGRYCVTFATRPRASSSSQ